LTAEVVRVDCNITAFRFMPALSYTAVMLLLRNHDHMDNLFKEFPPSDLEAWKKETERLLKGKSLDEVMLTSAPEGIIQKPIYTKEDISEISWIGAMPGYSPYVRGSRPGPGWLISQELSCPDPKELNSIILNALNNGQTALNLVMANGSVQSVADLKQVLEGVDLKIRPVFFQAMQSGPAYLGLYTAAAKEAGVAEGELKGAIATDPIGAMALFGEAGVPLKSSLDQSAWMVDFASNQAPLIGVLWVHGEIFHDGGGSAVQELAFMIASGVEYLRAMEERGIPAKITAPLLRFSCGLGSTFFIEAAKVRALRLLWDRILDLCGLSSETRSCWVHGRTSRFSETVYDYHVNMLRASTQAFSGIVGGIDSLHVAPFDSSIVTDDEHSRRIARNIQIILKEEVGLDKVLDPAGGAWCVERTTEEIASKSWDLFQIVEKMGGMTEALKAGFPQEEVRKCADEKAREAALGKKVMVGINRYPNPEEQYKKFVNPPVRNKIESPVKLKKGAIKDIEGVREAVSNGATVEEINKASLDPVAEIIKVAKVVVRRGGEAFEALRSAVEDKDLHVFLATLGPVSGYMARLDFSVSFFEVGGFKVIRTKGFGSPAEAVEAAKLSKASVVVICGKDSDYPASAAEIASQVKSFNKNTVVVLAGVPDKDSVISIRESGVDHFIHATAHRLNILADIAAKTGALS